MNQETLSLHFFLMASTDNTFTFLGLQPLYDSLRVNITLTSLILKSLFPSEFCYFLFWFHHLFKHSDNDIGDIGIVRLCDALKTTKSLTTLDLSRI